MAKSCEIPNGELSEFDLPRVCVMTGSFESIEFHPVKFQWYPRWIAVFVPFAMLIALILIAVMTKRVSGKLPFSTDGWERYQRGKRFSIFAVLAFFGGFALAVVGGINELTPLVIVGLLVMLVLPIVLLVGFTRGTRINVTRITESHITLKLPNDAAAEAFSAHLLGGNAAPALR